MTTGTEAAHVQTVSRETPALPLTLPDGAPATPAGVDVLADARAEARSWSPNTRRAYVAGWKHFTSWCIEHRCAGLPSEVADVGHYMENVADELELGKEGKGVMQCQPGSGVEHRSLRNVTDSFYWLESEVHGDTHSRGGG